MADDKHVEILRLGAEAWNSWYRGSRNQFADLNGAQLSCQSLAGVNLARAKLRDADLRYTDLTGADLRGADLTGTKLGRAILCRARLEDTLGLTQEQLHFAEGDESVRLPKGLRRPLHWSRSRDIQTPVAEPSTAS